MADVRTLKLNLLADVDQFGRSLNKADDDTKSFTKSISKYGKMAAAAFTVAAAAAGAYAIKIGIDGVKAAVEDEKSQRVLAIQLEKTVGANDSAIASVEKYIAATQLRVGVQDDKLRPSFARLLRSTDDVTQAQKLLNLALDISVATGKDVDTVAAALGKAYDGNTASLGRLGLGVDSTILKSGDLDLIMGTLTKTFGGFADREAKTFDGQLRIVNIRIDELKENIGKNLLPVLGTLLEKVNVVAQGFSGDDPKGLSARALELGANIGDGGAYSLGTSLRAVADAFGRLFTEIASPDALTGVSTLQKLANALETFAKAIDILTRAYDGYFKVYNKVPDFLKTAMNPIARIGQYIDIASGSRAAGGPVMGGQAYRVGEFGPETFVPSGSGSIRPNNASNQGVTIIMNGVIDGESARRSIERLLQDSSRRTGAINLVGATL